MPVTPGVGQELISLVGQPTWHHLQRRASAGTPCQDRVVPADVVLTPYGADGQRGDLPGRP